MCFLSLRIEVRKICTFFKCFFFFCGYIESVTLQVIWMHVYGLLYFLWQSWDRGYSSRLVRTLACTGTLIFRGIDGVVIFPSKFNLELIKLFKSFTPDLFGANIKCAKLLTKLIKSWFPALTGIELNDGPCSTKPCSKLMRMIVSADSAQVFCASKSMKGQ